MTTPRTFAVVAACWLLVATVVTVHGFVPRHMPHSPHTASVSLSSSSPTLLQAAAKKRRRRRKVATEDPVKQVQTTPEETAAVDDDEDDDDAVEILSEKEQSKVNDSVGFDFQPPKADPAIIPGCKCTQTPLLHT